MLPNKCLFLYSTKKAIDFIIITLIEKKKVYQLFFAYSNIENGTKFTKYRFKKEKEKS